MEKRHRNGVNEHEQRTKKGLAAEAASRYARRNREGKSRMLDELCDDYEYERKYAIKLLSGGLVAAVVRLTNLDAQGLIAQSAGS